MRVRCCLPGSWVLLQEDDAIDHSELQREWVVALVDTSPEVVYLGDSSSSFDGVSGEAMTIV